jgi:hypothetical protein
MRQNATVNRIRIVALLWSATLVAGCARPISLFSLALDNGVSGEVVELVECPRRPAEREGWISSLDGEATSYDLVQPVRLSPVCSVLTLTFEPIPAAGVITVVDDEGQTIGHYDLADVPRIDLAGVSRLKVSVAVDTGVVIAGFVIDARTEEIGEGEDDPAEENTFRLVGAAIEPGEAGIRRTEEALWIGVGTAVEQWPTDNANPAGRWVVTPDESIWRPDLPVSIGYQCRNVDGVERPVADLFTGERTFTVDLRPGEHELILYPEAEGIRIDSVSIATETRGLSIVWIEPRPADLAPREPIRIDLGALLRHPQSSWRHSSFEVFSWSLYPQILVIDTDNYETQARFFKRLAFFVEKEGYRGRILSNHELEGLHGYNAHNYNAEGLASFYSHVADSEITLNAEELVLRSILLDAGTIVRAGDEFRPGTGGVLGVSQESASTPGLQRLLLGHEGLHGAYYMEPGYVEATELQWAGLSEDEQRYWLLLLDGMHYDVSDEYLVKNEYQAYLMQQSVEYAGWYLEIRSAERLRSWFPAEVEWIDRFLETYAGTHRLQAESLQDALWQEAGLHAGDLFDLEIQ